MTFKDYRHRTSVRAATITEETIWLLPHDRDSDNDTTKPYSCGDYVELVGGMLYGWKKADFEAAFESRRAERQSKTTRRKREKVKIADA